MKSKLLSYQSCENQSRDIMCYTQATHNTYLTKRNKNVIPSIVYITRILTYILRVVLVIIMEFHWFVGHVL